MLIYTSDPRMQSNHLTKICKYLFNKCLLKMIYVRYLKSFIVDRQTVSGRLDNEQLELMPRNIVWKVFT